MPTKPAAKVDTKAAAKTPVGKKKAVVVVADESPAKTKATKAVAKARSTRNADEPSLAEAVVEGLFTVGSSVVSSLADQVMRQFEDDRREVAIGTLVSILCRASGIPHDVESENVTEESSVAVLLDEALAHAPEGMTTYPLINKEQKKFRKAFPAFFERFTELAFAAGLLDDGDDEEFALAPFVPWLFAMAGSKSRSFRHTATAAILSMVAALSNAVTRTDEAATGASTKKEQAAAQKRVALARARHAALFDLTLLQRCKDTSPEIRLLTFQALRHLIVSNPGLHVDNKYLRFLSIALNDKKVDVRVEGLDTIAQVLGTLQDYAPRMTSFLVHVHERLVELTADVETKVADLALKVAALIVKCEHDTATTENIFNDAMMDSLLTGVADDRRVIRTTAGTLLKMFIRCRVDTASGPRGRADVLASFAATLHAAYHEPWAERYIVDAVWGESPPAILTDFKHFVAIAQDKEDVEKARSAVSILACIMQRCRGHLDFGPAAKDDMRTTLPASAADKQKVDEKELLSKLTKETTAFLADALDTHAADEGMIAALAGLVTASDLEQFAGTRQRAQLEEILAALRRATGNAREPATFEALGAAWKHLVLTESPSRVECEAQFQLLLKAALKQALDAMAGSKPARGGRSKASQDASSTVALDSAEVVSAMHRVRMVSALASLIDHWSFLSNCLTRFVDTAESNEDSLASSHELCSATAALVGAVYTTGLWVVAAHGEGVMTQSDVAATLEEVLPKLTRLAAIDVGTAPHALEVRSAAVCAIADFAALPFISVTSSKQGEITSVCIDVVDKHLEALADATGTLRAATKPSDPDLVERDPLREVARHASAVTAARRTVSALEAATTRVASGVSRLFVFKRLAAEPWAAQWMQLWPRVSSAVKPAGDAFKTLFHVLRERTTTDTAALEKQILHEGTTRCANIGAHSAALEQLHQLGLKLSSMHFLPTDKFYSAGVAVVKNAIESASAGNELILHGVVPYCARLRIADALAINNGFSSSPLFSAPQGEQSTFVRAFISAVRRAAKLEAVPAAAAMADVTPARGGSMAANTAMRTGRTATTVGTTVRRRGTQLEVDDEDDFAGVSHVKGQKTRPISGSQRPQPQPSAEAVTTDGWRGRGVSAAARPTLSPPKPSQSQRGGTQQPSSTQLTASSMMDEGEVFIATQEWE